MNGHIRLNYSHETWRSGEACPKSEGKIYVWYVVQVKTGTEERIKKQCERVIDEEILVNCFLPYYEEQKKYQGAWHVRRKILFPGYVFLVSDHLEELFGKLKNVIGLTKLIGTGREIVPLTDEEVVLLQRLGKDDQVVEMSTGIIINGKVRVISGPLEDMEGYIKRIDRHKRKAVLEIEMFGRSVEMQAGLEIIEKI